MGRRPTGNATACEALDPIYSKTALLHNAY